MAEAGETSLYLRRKQLTDRLIARTCSKDLELLSKIRELSINNLICSYWMKRPSPILCDSFTDWSNDLNWIRESSIPYSCTVPFCMLKSPVPSFELPQRIYETPGLTNTRFGQFLQTRWPDRLTIYTDGSVNQNKAGSAFVVPSHNVKKQYRLWDRASIYSAETFAVQKALQYALEHARSTTLIIITDSRSMTTKMRGLGPSSKLTKIEATILNRIYTLKTLGTRVIFCWVRGHSRIMGNHAADTQANGALTLPDSPPSPDFPQTDLKRPIGAKMKNQWVEDFHAYNGGETYKQRFPRTHLQPWFKQVTENMPKTFYRTVTRLRSGHSCCNSNLYRMHLVESPACRACGQLEETNEHIVLECPEYSQARVSLLRGLQKMILNPFNLDSIMAADNVKVNVLIFNFTQTINIRIYINVNYK
uniref:ribonuclease H n=3 Tax=Lygus hesperus TaxID=30085 RepID=A0A146L706_LYGHE